VEESDMSGRQAAFKGYKAMKPPSTNEQRKPAKPAKSAAKARGAGNATQSNTTAQPLGRLAGKKQVTAKPVRFTKADKRKLGRQHASAAKGHPPPPASPDHHGDAQSFIDSIHKSV